MKTHFIILTILFLAFEAIVVNQYLNDFLSGVHTLVIGLSAVVAYILIVIYGRSTPGV